MLIGAVAGRESNPDCFSLAGLMPRSVSDTSDTGRSTEWASKTCRGPAPAGCIRAGTTMLDRCSLDWFAPTSVRHQPPYADGHVFS